VRATRHRAAPARKRSAIILSLAVRLAQAAYDRGSTGIFKFLFGLSVYSKMVAVSTEFHVLDCMVRTNDKFEKSIIITQQ
jgi:hypothetical protein